MQAKCGQEEETVAGVLAVALAVQIGVDVWDRECLVSQSGVQNEC